MSSKGKAIADGKGKRKIDDSDKTGRRSKKRSGVLQFFEDSAHEADDSESSLDSIFDDDDGFLEDLFDTESNIHPEPYKSVMNPVVPKEEEMTEEEHEKMLEKLVQERYKPGSSFVTYAEDRNDSQRSITRGSVNFGDPVVWKTKCMVGRERHSAFCLMQKYADHQLLGKKLQIVSAFVVEHVKGALFIEAYKKNDIYEACNGICTIYPSRVAAVKSGEISNLLSVRSRHSTVNVGTFARVKRGIYKGDLAQVVAVNDSRRKATVKLIPRIDIQALAAKFGGGAAAKKTDIPAPRLICSSELEEFRPLIHSRRDHDSKTTYEVLDGMSLKDGYLYKKVPFDSLTLYGIQPTQDELLKFESRSDEANDVEWLSEIYGEQNKSCTRKSDKGGGKGVGSSSSNLENGFEVHDMVFFSRTGFGVIIGIEKDGSFKVLKEGTEGQQIVNVKRRDLKKASFDNKFTAWDCHKKIISINDSVRILEGQLEGRQGVVKQIYRGTVFLYDDDAQQENSGYLCCKAQNCEKFEHFGDACKEKGKEQAPLGFDDFSSSPKSPLSPKKPWQERDTNLNQGEKDEIFSVGQSLRIRIGPLKGYLCRVLALRRSDVTVKLDSQHKILTVKAEHLVPVQASVPTSGVLESKPFDLLGTQEGGSGGWVDGAAGTSSDAQGWGAGGQTTERNSWNAFPSTSFSLNPGAESLDPPNSMDIDSSKDDGGSGWETKSAPTQDSSWGVAATDETALASAEQVGAWGKSDGDWSKATSDDVGGSSKSDSWGKAKVSSDDQPDSSNGAWGAANNNTDGGWGISEGSMVKENNASDNTASGWGSANVKNQNESWGTVADTETGGWGNGSGRDSDGNGGGGRSGGRGGGRGGHAGRGGASGGSCYKCGETGHMARECSQGGGSGSNACYKCGESGHMARECSQGGGSNACYKCGESGHMARECSQGGGGGNACYKCGESGHMARECTQGGSAGGGGSRGGNACYKCGETGHMARECTQGGNRGGNACYKCGETGHMARECSQGGGGRGNSCYKCGETGHMARECNQGSGADSNGLNSWSNSNKDAGVTSWSTKVAANQNSSWGATAPQNEIGGWSSKVVQNTSIDTPDTETGGWGNAWNKTSDTSKDAGSSWGAVAPLEKESEGWSSKAGWNTSIATTGKETGGWDNSVKVGGGSGGQEGSSSGGNACNLISSWGATVADDTTGKWGAAAPEKEIGGWSNKALQNASTNTPDTETGGWSSSWNKSNADTSKDAGSSWGTAAPGKEKGRSSKEGWNVSKATPYKDTGGWDGAGKVSGSGGRGGGASGSSCYKCGESGHMARECTQGGSKGGNACYKCGESGHMARECTQGGSRGDACYKCGESGHMARECPQGGSRGGGSCYKCGETGHMARDCSQGGGSGRNSCYKCGETGHMSRECGKPGGTGNNCFKCGESGHKARDCTQGGGGGYGMNSWSATNLQSQPECNITDRVNSIDNDSWKKDASSGWGNKVTPNDNSSWGAAKSDEKLATSTNTWGNKWNNNEGSSSKEITSEKVTTGWGSSAEPCASNKDGNTNKDDSWKGSNLSSEKGTGGWGGAGGSWG